jgi:hypothetical protein
MMPGRPLFDHPAVEWMIRETLYHSSCLASSSSDESIVIIFAIRNLLDEQRNGTRLYACSLRRSTCGTEL